jgi:hypothetical protein
METVRPLIRWPFRIIGGVLCLLSVLVWIGALVEHVAPGNPDLGFGWVEILLIPLFVIMVGTASVCGRFPRWFERITPAALRRLLGAGGESSFLHGLGWKGTCVYVFLLGPAAVVAVLALGGLVVHYAWLAEAYLIAAITVTATLFVAGAALFDLFEVFTAARQRRGPAAG